MNEEKEKLLNLVNSEDFYLQNSEELEGIYQQLTSPWEFMEQSKPLSMRDYLATFSKIPNSRTEKHIRSKYLQKKGRLRVIGFGGYQNRSDGAKSTTFLCECYCGNKETRFRQDSMPFSCGCLTNNLQKIQSRLRGVKRLESRVGEKHHRLKIIGISPERVSEKAMVLVQCDCGESEPFSVVYVSLIPQGKNKRVNTKSCGCLMREMARERHRENALKYVGETKNNLRIDSLDGYDSISKKQLANATCLACNTEVIVRLNDWQTGQKGSCGCLEGYRERKSYNGIRYMFLEVLKDALDRTSAGGKVLRYVVCKCHACGDENYELRLDNIINQQQVSCGCIQFQGKDNLIDFILQEEYANRTSTTYLVTVDFQGQEHIKIGIAFNFLNRKSVAKRDGIPYIKTLKKVELERSKSWLLEKLILLKLQKFRLFSLAGKVQGGTEIFNLDLNEDLLVKTFDEEFNRLKNKSFQDCLKELDCKIPTNWIKGEYDRSGNKR